MSTRFLKAGYLFFLMVIIFFSQFSFESSKADAADRTEYVVPGPDAYANGQAWRDAADTLYFDTETTGTKTVSLGRGEYRFIGGNDAMHYPGIHHIGLGDTIFSLENSDDDITTGVIVYGGISPRENTYFENLVFRYRSSTSGGDLVGLLLPYIYFKNCAFVGNSTDTSWVGTGIANSAGQAIPGEDILTLDGCKIIKMDYGVYTFSKIKVKDSRIQAKRAFYCTADALDAMEGTNTIDLATGVPRKRAFLQLADHLPTALSLTDTKDDDRSTTEILSGFWMHIRLLAPPDGHIVTSLEEAFQYLIDFRHYSSPSGIISSGEVKMKNEYKEYNPFPSDVHIYLDTGEPRTAIKLWQGYE